MNEQEQQNQRQSFIRQMWHKGEATLRKTKKTIKNIIRIIKILLNPLTWKLLVIIALVSAIVTFFTGFLNIIIKFDEEKVNNAKHTAITTFYPGSGGNNYTTETDGNGKTVSKVVVKPNNNENGYEIAYDDTTENIEDVKEYIDNETDMDSSEFTDFELGIIDALVDNGADLQYYTEEKVHCFPAFIKAEAATQNLDLRPNSEKQTGKTAGDFIDNYEPEKRENLAENEVPGVILVQRTNTNGTKKTLEYKEKEGENGFDKLVEANDESAINYFTINEKGELVYAKWYNTKIEVDGEYPERLPESEKDVELDETFIVTDEIPYIELIKKYTMPFEFLVQLLAITEDTDFCMELVDCVLDSKIVINIQEEEIITVTTEDKTYDIHYKEEKSIDYEMEPDIESKTNYLIRTKDDEVIIDDGQKDCTKDDEENECTIYEYEETTEPVIITTTRTEHTYTFGVVEADTWLALYKEEGFDIPQEKIDTKTIDNEKVEKIGVYEPQEETIVNTSEEILKDKHVGKFKEKKEKYYKDKVAVPKVSVKDGYDSTSDEYWKQIEIQDLNVKFKTTLKNVNTKYYRRTETTEDGETVYVYDMPSSFSVNTIATGDLIGGVTYNYSINSNYTYSLVSTNKDDVIKCNISKLSINPYTKINVTTVTNQMVTKFPANDNITKSTKIYAVDNNGKFQKFLAAYDNSKTAQKQLNSIESWLFEMMEENTATEELEDIIKYLLYKYDGNDRGVTELEDFEDMFKPDEFIPATGGGSALFNNDITKEEFVNTVKSYSVPSGSGSYGTYKWGYEKYFIPNAENFYNIATKYGLDPRFIFCIGIHESGFGTSKIANEKGNFFGWGANDSNPYGDAHSFYDMSAGIEAVCKGLANNYVSPSGSWYQWIIDKGFDPTTIDGIGCRYASDTNWATAVKKHIKNIFKYEPTNISNADFLTVAKECHDYIRTNNFYYSSAANKKAGKYVGDGTSTGNGKIPYPNGTQYTDCSAYITWVLYEYGYDHFTSQKTSAWFMDRDAMKKMGWTVLPASQAEAGDIVAKNGHVEIYAGNGKFYNAGCTEAIRKEISNSGVKYLNTFTYAIRVTKP